MATKLPTKYDIEINVLSSPRLNISDQIIDGKQCHLKGLPSNHLKGLIDVHKQRNAFSGVKQVSYTDCLYIFTLNFAVHSKILLRKVERIFWDFANLKIKTNIQNLKFDTSKSMS